MADFDPKRVQRLAVALDAALRASPVHGADGILAQVELVLRAAAEGNLTEPIARLPGWYHFVDSGMPADPVAHGLWFEFAAAIEIPNSEREATPPQRTAPTGARSGAGAAIVANEKSVERLNGLPLAGLLAALGEANGVPEVLPGVVWKQLPNGAVVEVQLGPDGTGWLSSVIAPRGAKSHQQRARRCMATAARQAALMALSTAGFGEDLLNAVAGETRDGLRHLETTLYLKGSQVRLYALVDGPVIELALHPDGAVRWFRTVAGYSGQARIDAADRVSPSLPEHHPQPLAARSWGEAFAHARAQGSAVIRIREHYGARQRVELLCEDRATDETPWFPRLGVDDTKALAETTLATRTYTIANRQNLSPSYLGTADKSLLTVRQWAAFATALVAPGDGRPVSKRDHDIAKSALEVAQALIDSRSVDARERPAPPSRP